MSNSGTIRVALIGAGGMGTKWAHVLAKSPSASLVCISDQDKSKAEVLAKEIKDCRAEGDWRAVVQSSDVDAVVIVTPHKFLTEIAIEALKNKKHVLSEKPGGVSSLEIIKAIKASEESGAKYMIGFNHRYHPAFLMAKDLVDKGEIGKIIFVRARYGFGGRPGYANEWRFNKEMSGGGELLDQGSHMIDLSRQFLGEFSEVVGFTPTLFWKNGVEDNGFALLKTQDGRVASIHVSWTQWKWVHSFEIMGSEGYLTIDGLDNRYVGPERLTIGKRDPEFRNPPTEQVVIFDKETSETSLERLIAEFISAIQENREPAVSGKDAYEMLKIVEKIYAQNK